LEITRCWHDSPFVSIYFIREDDIFCSRLYSLLLFPTKLWIQNDWYPLISLSTSTEANKPQGCVWIGERMCEDLREWMCEDLREKCEENEVFGLRYVKVNVWGKIFEVCKWCDSCEKILNIFNNKICTGRTCSGPDPST